MTPLGKIITTKAGTVTKAEEFATRLEARARTPRGETLEVPGFGTVRINLVGTVAWQEIQADTDKAMRARSTEQTVLTADRYELERARRVLAQSFRDPDDHAKPFGTLEQWGNLDNDEIAVAYEAYGDVRERLDPLATEIDADETAFFEHAFKKKDSSLLKHFGLSKLCAWLTTTDGLRWSSPSPKSEPSPSSSESTPPSES